MSKIVKYAHYSHTRFELDREREYTYPYNGKPRGLWVSDDRDFGWREWTSGSNFEIGKHVYEVSIDTTKVCSKTNRPSGGMTTLERLQSFGTTLVE